MEITQEILDSHISKIVEIRDSIKLNKVTILVGDNGVGKSLIRKQLQYRFMRDFGKEVPYVRSVSMQLRTESRVEYGALSTIMHDVATDPTSLSTFALINSLLNEDTVRKDKYYIIDEPEIGMSYESQLGIAKFLKERLPLVVENSLGVLIVTHSSIIIEELMGMSDFINLGYNTVSYSVNEWLSRDLKPTDFEFLVEWSKALYKRVDERSGKGN